MTTTSDRDGRTPADPDPDSPFPTPPAPPAPAGYADADLDSPFPAPPAPGGCADADTDEQPTVVLETGPEPPAYSHDDVLPVGPVGGGRRAAREASTPSRRTGPTPLGRVVLPAALAVVSGVALVFGWVTLQDDRAQTAARAVPTASAGASVPAAPVVSTSPTAVTSTAPVVADSPSAPAASGSAPAASGSGPASSPSASASTTVDRSVPVVVLNSTTRTGLAAKVAAQLRKAGWTVVSIGNYRTRLAATTVFAEGHANAVATIKADLPTDESVKPPAGAMNPARLTVVLGPDYPRG
jgi:hypothetical protein